MKSDGNKAVREEIPGTCRKVPWVENTLCYFLADGSDQLTGGKEKMGLTWMRGGGVVEDTPSGLPHSVNLRTSSAKVRCFRVVSEARGRVQTLICWDII